MTDDDLDVGGVNYERVDPMRTWRLTADAEAAVKAGGEDVREPGRPARLRMDLAFEALTPPIGTDGLGRAERSGDDAAATAQSVGKGHLEQSGRWSGTITVDDEVIDARPVHRPGQPRQVVGPQALGRAADVAVVLDQHRRRHPLRRHPHRHPGRRPAPRLGVAGRRGDVDPHAGT